MSAQRVLLEDREKQQIHSKREREGKRDRQTDIYCID